MTIIKDSKQNSKKFKQLIDFEKIKIETLLNETKSLRYIAKQLNKSPSTISRHVRKYLVLQNPSKPFYKNNNPMVYSANCDIFKTYDRLHKIRNKYGVINVYLEIEILDRIKKFKYLIGATIESLKREDRFKKFKFPSLANLYLQISKNWLKHIKKYHLKQYKSQKDTDKQQKRFYGVSITERSESINNRLEFSHWETDTVVGQKTDKKCVFTLVERVTNFVIWMLVDKGSAGIIQALNEIFKHQPELAATIKSITFDNGSEFAKTKEMQFGANGNKDLMFTMPGFTIQLIQLLMNVQTNLSD